MKKAVSPFRSLRFRITALAMIVVVVVLALVAVVLLRSVKQHVLQQVDRSLVSEATYTRTQLQSHAYLPKSGPQGALGQLFLADGALVGSSINLQGQPRLIHPTPVGSTPKLLTVDNPRFGPLRVAEVQLGGSRSPILVEAQQIGQLLEGNNSLTLLLAVLLPILAVLLGLLIWTVVGLAMKPVETIRAAVDEISEGSLDERVPSPRTGDELERLVDTMNGMLQRLQKAIRRERRFIADASHELRTPIAAMKAALELSDDDPMAIQASHRTALSSLQGLEILAEDLLLLGSDPKPPKAAELRPVDIDELVFEKADQLRRITSLEIDTSKVSGGQVLASEVDVMRVIENLLSNAVRHADSYIGLAVVENGATVCLTVSDDGAGVPLGQRESVFERFVRIESDRTRTSGGAGLGLSIVSDIVGRYGGTVKVGTSPRGGACFVVEMLSAVSFPECRP